MDSIRITSQFLRSTYVILYSSSLPAHQDQRNPMWFARSPQQDFLFLPPQRPSLARRVLLRHRVRDRRNRPAVFRRRALHSGRHSPGRADGPAKENRAEDRQSPALRAPDRLFEPQAHGTREAATRAACHRSRTGVGSSGRMASSHRPLQRGRRRNFTQRTANKWRSKSWRDQRLARRRPSARHHPGLLSPRTTNPKSPSPKPHATEAICNLKKWSDGRPRPSKQVIVSARAETFPSMMTPSRGKCGSMKFYTEYLTLRA